MRAVAVSRTPGAIARELGPFLPATSAALLARPGGAEPGEGWIRLRTGLRVERGAPLFPRLQL